MCRWLLLCEPSRIKQTNGVWLAITTSAALSLQPFGRKHQLCETFSFARHAFLEKVSVTAPFLVSRLSHNPDVCMILLSRHLRFGGPSV